MGNPRESSTAAVADPVSNHSKEGCMWARSHRRSFTPDTPSSNNCQTPYAFAHEDIISTTPGGNKRS